MRSASIAGAVLVVAPFINTFGLRKIFWQLHLALAKPFFNLSRANAAPIGRPPLGLPFLFQCLFAGFLLILTWELTSILFLTYATQEPTKNGLPLSSTSRDPNGTLLNGLKAKRDVVKTFAFWELAIIAQKHKDRRKTIFEDIERPTGPMWNQIIAAGLKVLRDIDTRILGPPPKSSQPSANPTIKTLPNIVPELQSQSSIFQRKSKPGVEELLVSSPLRQLGSSKQPWHPPVEQTAKKMESKLLEYVNPSGSRSGRPQGLLEQWTTHLRRSPVGWFFISTDAAKINATVLGSPNGNAAVIVDAIDSTTKMLIASLGEDTYGKATPTVPDAVRTFTKTLSTIEDYTAEIHPETRAQIEEVEVIVERLRAGLKELLAAFQLYLLDVGLGIAELNQAKRVVEVSNPEPMEAKLAEQPTRRQLFSGDGQRTKSGSRQRVPITQEEPTHRIEPSQRSSNNVGRKQGMNGRAHQRREMEQVR
jgi:nucleoporin NDC1